LPFESQTYTASTVHNPEYDTPFVRYVYNGLKAPTKVIDYNVKTEEHIVRKQQEVLDPDFHEADYHTKRIWAKAEDGSDIPISLVYKKGIHLDGNNPLLLYGYGSYGVTVDPSFSSNRLSLLDRGF